MKRKKINKKFLKKIPEAILIAFICVVGIKVASILIVTPIISFYNAAYNFYALSGDASYFEVAASATKTWLVNLITLCLGVLLYKIIKKKRENKNE